MSGCKGKEGLCPSKVNEPDFDKNYIVIQGWMTRLGLTPPELLLSALIRGFCSYRGATFHGSLSWIQKWLGVSSKKTGFNLLESLEEKNLITHETGGGKSTNKYSLQWDYIEDIIRASREAEAAGASVKITPVDEGDTDVKITPGVVKITPVSGVKITPALPKYIDYLNTDTYNDISSNARERARESSPLLDAERRRQQHDQRITKILQHDWVNDDGD